MAPVKAVLFDYGNVLCMPQLESDLEAMAESCHVELSRFKTWYWQLRDEYDLGRIDGRTYFSHIAEKAGHEISEQEIAHAIHADNIGWTRANPTMANWAAKLRAAGISTAIVSNMPLDIREYLRSCEWLPAFDQYTFSCDINSVKPADEIYLYCLNELGLQPNETLFLDDRPMNVDAAARLGIFSLVFSTAENLQPKLAEFELPAIDLI